MKKFIKYFCLVYVALCFIVSIAVSYGNYNILEIRKPFLVVEVSDGVVVGEKENGKMYGFDEFGYYRAFHDGKIGDTVTSVFVYNPLNNYSDDIMFRFDF